MKRDVEDITLTIDDLRRRLLIRSVDEGSEDPREEIDPDENRELDRELKQYILAGVCGAIVALLIMNIVS
jgi:hypothetical protein